MAYGLQIRDANNNLLVDTPTQTGQIGGIFTVVGTKAYTELTVSLPASNSGLWVASFGQSSWAGGIDYTGYTCQAYQKPGTTNVLAYQITATTQANSLTTTIIYGYN